MKRENMNLCQECILGYYCPEVSRGIPCTKYRGAKISRAPEAATSQGQKKKSIENVTQNRRKVKERIL